MAFLPQLWVSGRGCERGQETSKGVMAFLPQLWVGGYWWTAGHYCRVMGSGTLLSCGWIVWLASEHYCRVIGRVVGSRSILSCG